MALHSITDVISNRKFTLLVVALSVVAIAITRATEAARCNSGILQLQKFDWDGPDSLADCYPGLYSTISDVKGLCGVAFKAEVTSDSIIKMIPLSTATRKYSDYPGPSSGTTYALPCKDLNASGLFNPGSTTAGTVMMFDDVGRPLTHLHKFGNVICLNPSHMYGSQCYPAPSCMYNYTVVTGCFMGVSAPRPAPAVSCPKNWYIASGRFNLKYCAPCEPGNQSAGGKATKCTPCPAGTFNSRYGYSCKKCEPGAYSNTVGSTSCKHCAASDNKYTNGRTCKPCPSKSWVFPSNPSQCMRCNKGVKCCTAGSSSSCPKCTAGHLPDTKNYTSVFALASASSASCLASSTAVCCSKWSVTIDFTCAITVQGLQKTSPDASAMSCDFRSRQPIKGRKANAKTDFADWDQHELSREDSSWSNEQALMAGHLSKAYAPFVDFVFPHDHCTLTFRAITAPAASILGVPPKAGTSMICPPGQYLDKKPGSCLPCPPGTYNPTASSKTSCTPCPAGQYANKFGSNRCTKCPPATVTPFTLGTGAAGCTACPLETIFVGTNKCATCPANTEKSSEILQQINPLHTDADLPAGCIGNNNGNVCCGAGDCGGAPPCPKPLLKYTQDDTAGAVFQLVKTSLAGGGCRNATFLTCLDSGAYVAIAFTSHSSFRYYPLMQPKCLDGGGIEYTITLDGAFVSHTRGVGSYISRDSNGAIFTTRYDFVSDKATDTLTIYLRKHSNPAVTVTPHPTTCSASFKLVAGYAFDLTPPARARCPTGLIPFRISGRTFCKLCGFGFSEYQKGRECALCPGGTYQNLLGATSCKTCPAGFSCPEGEAWQAGPCSDGYYSDVPGLAECKKCTKNTYSSSHYGATQCVKCPKYTTAPVAASACGVPFMTRF